MQSLMNIPTTGLRSLFLLALLDLKHRECRCCDGEKRMFETELSQYPDQLCSPNVQFEMQPEKSKKTNYDHTVKKSIYIDKGQGGTQAVQYSVCWNSLLRTYLLCWKSNHRYPYENMSLSLHRCSFIPMRLSIYKNSLKSRKKK